MFFEWNADVPRGPTMTNIVSPDNTPGVRAGESLSTPLHAQEIKKRAITFPLIRFLSDHTKKKKVIPGDECDLYETFVDVIVMLSSVIRN